MKDELKRHLMKSVSSAAGEITIFNREMDSPTVGAVDVLLAFMCSMAEAETEPPNWQTLIQELRSLRKATP